MAALDLLKSALYNLVRLAILGVILYASVSIRLEAVRVYGRVIHEFDPWFNYRATEYLVNNGYEKFKNWYDEEAWYPLGRHVGSTIYPGMIVTAANIYHLLSNFDLGITLNDVCVFIPAGFSILSCLFTLGLAYEASGSANAALLAAGIMAIIPSHLMRSVAGGYDNESVAVAAIIGTFYFWVRSQKNASTYSWTFSILAGLTYVYMVSAWGGYVFVLNMVGIHAALLAAKNLFLEETFNYHLHKCYSTWFVIGTIGALQFPFVGWLPFQSMEQLGPFFVFLGLQGLYALNYIKTSVYKDEKTFRQFREKLVMGLVAVGAIGFNVLLSMGYIHGLSNRVRSLFIPHTHTGNPLVDSVAEHQSTPPTVYWHYFHVCCYFGPIGFFTCVKKNPTPAQLFIILYCLLSAYFSSKMIRLVLLLAPAASIASGLGIYLLLQWVWAIASQAMTQSETESSDAADDSKKKKEAKKPAKKSGSLSDIISNLEPFKLSSVFEYRTAQLIGAFIVAVILFRGVLGFTVHSFRVAQDLSEPSIMLRGRSPSGEPVIIDDFRQAYWFLRDKTPQDSRVLAWWDYGYQINGIANRTSIADGNTWNHEHIALLGRCLVSPEEESWRMVRHLADYVLVWTTRYAGMPGDDLAKMPHMARIGGSVFSDLNPNDYWIDQNDNPSPKLRKSLLYKLHAYGYQPEVTLSKFEEAYTSPNRMVRIYKVKDVAERHPVGKYPEELDYVLKKSKAFKQ